MSGSRHDLLMKGLVGDRLDLYLNNIRFYTAVNMLAGWLPILVDGLAVRAGQEADAEAVMFDSLQIGNTE